MIEEKREKKSNEKTEKRRERKQERDKIEKNVITYQGVRRCERRMQLPRRGTRSVFLLSKLADEVEHGMGGDQRRGELH